MEFHEMAFGFELQKRMRSAEHHNPRLTSSEASFACDYPCGCYRVFSVSTETVEVTLSRGQGCEGKCLPSMHK